MSIKLISINIEGSRHLRERVLPFLLKEKPDVVCLQEVFNQDVEEIKKTLGMTGQYLPMAIVNQDNEHLPTKGAWGLMVMSKLPVSESGYEYYYGTAKDLPVFFTNNDPNSVNRVLAWLKVEHGGKSYTFATTHFTWSPAGSTTELQLDTFAKLSNILDGFSDVVISGDFNAPRGGEIFSALSKRYQDNIPSHIKTTVDNNLHRAKNDIFLVVDGMFSSKHYQVEQVKVESGVSDHMALVGTVTRL